MNEDQAFLENKPNDNIIAQIIHRYLPFWPIFVICASISLAVASIYLRAQTKIYVASAKVLLKDPNKGNGDTKVLDALNIFSEKKTIENEIIVLRSTSLMEEVVKNLNLYAPVFNEGKVQKEELYADNSPIKFIAINKDSIKANGKFFIEIDWVNAIVKIAGQRVPFNGTFKIGTTEYRIELNMEYNRNASGKNYYVVFNSPKSAAGSILSTLKASPLSYNSTVIDLKLETPIAEKGINILNELFVVYNRAGIEDKNEMATKTLNFIEDRLNTVMNQLDSVEKNIQTYKSTFDVIDLGNQATVYFNNVKELDKVNSTLDIQTQLLDELLKYTNAKGKKSGTVPSLVLLNDETLKSLLSQLYTAEFDLENAKSTAGAKSEVVLLAEGKVNQIKNDIRENIGNIRNAFWFKKTTTTGK